MPLSHKHTMPLRTIVRTKGEGKEHDKEKHSEMDEDESNHNTAFSKSGIVSAIRKTIAKYTISRPHSPVNSRPASPGPRNSTTSDEGLDEDEPPSAPPVKTATQIKQRPPLRTSTASRELKKEDSRKDAGGSRVSFDIPPPPPELLSVQDLNSLFSGAPVFSIIKEGNETPEPRVFFPFDDEDDEELEELSDCPPIAHPAFSLCTSRPHKPSNPDARGRRAKDDSDLEELGGMVEEEPSMLSFMGLEPGTCGWEYFMMYPVGDFAKTEDNEDDDIDEIDEGGRERSRRGSMGNGKGGVRSVETDYIVERLKELGEIWNERRRRQAQESISNIIISEIDDAGKAKGVLGKYSSLELYTQLFTRLLYPPTRISTEDFNDPYSLKVQAIALLETLAMKRFWLDFKDPHWRIRIGQILWGRRPSYRDDNSDDEEDEEDITSERDAEKVWLLLQILLACELAVRLDVLFSDDIVETPENQSVESKEDMCKRFKRIGTKKAEWDILLARRWLDNVQIIDDESAAEKDPASLAPPTSERRGWFSSRATPPSPPPEVNDDGDENGVKSYEALICPRNLNRQFSALMYFARSLQWPQIDTLSLQLQEKIRSASTFSTPSQSISGTPLATPLSIMSTNANSYFQAFGRPKRIQELASTSATPSVMTSSSSVRNSVLAKTMGSGGWLSRTFFSGLILPGEGLPHFLISTLLENDASAVESLGDNSILYAGFQYEGSTWWSSNCIVGRVLAGHGGSKEVGGWIGPCMDIKIPTENGLVYKSITNGWLNICSLLPEDEGEARVLKPRRVKEESNPLGTKYRESKSILSSDLSMPFDDVIPGEKVLLERLVLVEPSREDDLDVDVDIAIKYDTELHFQLGETEELAVRLKHEVFFITSFPCLDPPSSFKGMKKEGSEEHATKRAHPLHKEFEYSMVSIESLVREGDDPTRDRSHILVIEAGGEGKDRGVLARAWCSERGVNAIIGGRGRTCLSCCIREAKALGVDVVIRVG
ncbi:hypothetical protein DFP73DRAFT_536693 [Morchella snyderi]|nr:hypothetical protein DFP73DRAFT_536693 [Morchella snyderi]